MREFLNLNVITSVLLSLNPIQLFAGVKKVRNRALPFARLVNNCKFIECRRVYTQRDWAMLQPCRSASSVPEATVSENMQTQLRVAPPQLPPSVRPSKVFDTYWRFAAERQEIFFRRIAGAPPPWTADPILREFKFTNAYRASDRVSQYLIKQVIYAGDQNPDELIFRILVFKMFNRIETWELLEESLGGISLAAYDFDR